MSAETKINLIHEAKCQKTQKFAFSNFQVSKCCFGTQIKHSKILACVALKIKQPVFRAFSNKIENAIHLFGAAVCIHESTN